MTRLISEEKDRPISELFSERKNSRASWLFSNYMRNKFILLASYFSVLPIIIFALVLLSLSLQSQKLGGELEKNSLVQYRALPEIKAETEISVVTEDARIRALKDFFAKYDSELEKHAETFVESADIYKLDYRLLPAIAMQESNLCKKAPKNSFNCWGYGIYGGKVLRFDGYDEAILAIAKNLGHGYRSAGLEGPSEIVSKYTPSDDGKWVKSVTFFMDSIKNTLN